MDKAEAEAQIALQTAKQAAAERREAEEEKRKAEEEKRKADEMKKREAESEAKFRQKFPKVAEWADTFNIEIKFVMVFGPFILSWFLLFLFTILFLAMCSD